ncbi:MAG: protein NrnU [Betaproteobacteria bacterium]|nr:protein NrnU [Betaproteobacteria bacterium]
MLARLGPNAWKGIISVISLVGIIMMSKGYAAARTAPIVLWQSPVWLSHLVSLLTLVAFILFVAAYVPKNKIKSRLGHPMVISVKIWAFGHLLANGTLADLVLFGGLLAWAVMSFRAARQRDRREGTVRPAGAMGQTLVAIGLGGVIWAWFAFYGHAWLIGVQPFVRG